MSSSRLNAVPSLTFGRLRCVGLGLEAFLDAALRLPQPQDEHRRDDRERCERDEGPAPARRASGDRRDPTGEQRADDRGERVRRAMHGEHTSADIHRIASASRLVWTGSTLPFPMPDSNRTTRAGAVLRTTPVRNENAAHTNAVIPTIGRRLRRSPRTASGSAASTTTRPPSPAIAPRAESDRLNASRISGPSVTIAMRSSSSTRLRIVSTVSMDSPNGRIVRSSDGASDAEAGRSDDVRTERQVVRLDQVVGDDDAADELLDVPPTRSSPAVRLLSTTL